jgi:hypothetical protein
LVTWLKKTERPVNYWWVFLVTSEPNTQQIVLEAPRLDGMQFQIAHDADALVDTITYFVNDVTGIGDLRNVFNGMGVWNRAFIGNMGFRLVQYKRVVPLDRYKVVYEMMLRLGFFYLLPFPDAPKNSFGETDKLKIRSKAE